MRLAYSSVQVVVAVAAAAASYLAALALGAAMVLRAEAGVLLTLCIYTCAKNSQ